MSRTAVGIGNRTMNKTSAVFTLTKARVWLKRNIKEMM